MHIVIFNHYAGSPKMGMEYRPYYLAQEWIKNCHKVTIVAGTSDSILLPFTITVISSFSAKTVKEKTKTKARINAINFFIFIISLL